MVPVMGSVGGGARGLVHLGFRFLQPSEMIKIALVIALARYFHRARATGDLRLRDVIPAFAMLAIPGALILAQPDLGTVGVVTIVFFSVLFFAGLRMRSFLLLAIVGGCAIPLLWGHL